MSTKIELICSHCQTPFQKEPKEYNRHIRQGRTDFFCSLSCGTKRNNQLFKHTRRTDQLKRGNDVSDEYSPFRYYLRKAKVRNKEYDIDLPYLKELWEKQNGCCVYSNIPLVPFNKKKNDIRFMASLDRIDSSKGYIKGNVQYVSACMNYAKATLTDQEFREFMSLISFSLG